MPPRKPVRYKDAGVDIDEADRAVSRIKTLAEDTMTRGVLTGIGSFGAGFQLSGYKRPVLVSSADGVGTKLKVAVLTGRHDTIGEDLVNHCVNDIAVQGACHYFFSTTSRWGSWTRRLQSRWWRHRSRLQSQ
jgi:phosphoribosylformylglycinamidine cyclo-ligase